MEEAIVGPFVEKPVEKIIAAIFRQFNYLFRYNRNIQNLRAELQDLENKRNDVKASINEAKRNALIIKSEVDGWLEKVDNLMKVAEEVLNSTMNSEMRCLYLRCPNLKIRYLLSRNATKKTAEIVELQEAGKFDEVGKHAPLKLLSYHGSEALNSRISTRKEIIIALEDKDICIVGICGLPGVGKTTMAKEVMTQVQDRVFDEVTMAVVSRDVNIIRIQDDLADMLGLKFEERTNEIARAVRLAERLTQDNEKRILVILDDLWTEFDLKTLGITSLSHRKGLKILLTSRFKHVCERTGALRNIEVGVLPREEAFELFQDLAELSKISNNATKLKAIAEQVAEECKGLPLALEVVGKALRNRELHAWRDALNRLRNSQHGDKVFSSIQLSYDYLDSDEHRSLLLLCSLFPEDESIPIETLIRYARGLELFEYTETLLDTRDRTYTVCDNLKSCHLLLSGYKGEEVKLHDVIRDFCLSIASKGEQRYMVKHGLTTEWPVHDTHGSYSAISLTFLGTIMLPNRLLYGNLKFLRLLSYRNASIFEIPKEFFDDIQELRVLDFTRAHIRSPIQLSTGLRTLCLNHCILEFGISFLGSLKKLEILTFYGSSLSVDFPSSDEMLDISNLRLLDLGFDEGPSPLPPGFLLGMKKLEELYLGEYCNIRYEEKEHIIKEVSSLKALNTLQISTDDTQFLMQLLQACSEKLERFHIRRAGAVWRQQRPEHFGRCLILNNINRNMLTEPVIKSLMRRCDELRLSSNDWKIPDIETDEDGFVKLKRQDLCLLNSEYLFDAAISNPSGIFPNLENMTLSNMHNLPRRVSEPAPFCNLKIIKVVIRKVIKSLFSESVAKYMVNLQNLGIYSSSSLEEVVSMDTRENEITEPIVFPKLKIVRLHRLNRFVSFRSQSNAVALRQTLLNQVELPNMETLSILKLDPVEKLLSVEEIPFGSLNGLKMMRVLSCDNLVNIAQSNSIKLLQNLETLQVEKCRELNVIFDFEGLNVDIDDVEISMLGQLKSLKLRKGRSLSHIVRMIPEGICVFQNLKSLEVEVCSRLKYLFPASMINSFVGLETLSVRFCNKIEEIFGSEEDDYYYYDTDTVEGGGTASKIVFREEEEEDDEDDDDNYYDYDYGDYDYYDDIDDYDRYDDTDDYDDMVKGGGTTSKIVFREEEEEMVKGGGIASKIVFRKLRSIQLIELKKFKMFCPPDYELVFPSLDQLTIQNCHLMKKFCPGQLNAPKLEKVQIGYYTFIDISNFPNL